MPRHPARRPLALVPLLALLGAAVALLMPAGTASAQDYPLPTHEIGGVNKTVFQVGDLVVFTGDGYLTASGSNADRKAKLVLAPSAKGMTPGTVVVTDNGRERGTAQVDGNGGFRFTFRFTSDDTVGQHVLVGRGVGANTAARDTTSVVYLSGLAVSLPRGDTGTAVSGRSGGGALAFTGADIRDLVLLGLALVAVGTLLVVRNLRARDARRLARRERRVSTA